jgi:D-threo-aldose 1-dehydrogenase
MTTELPRIGLGTASLGGLFEPVGEEEAVATIERAWERGVRLFDTAPLYGFGQSERWLGRALADKPRDELVLATKVGRLLLADAPPDPGQPFWRGTPNEVNPVFDFSFDGVMRSFEESLERLGVDRIDVLHVHDPDNHLDEALTGAYPALERLRTEGTIRAVGVGANTVAPLLHFARETDVDCLLEAGRHTLLDRSATAELLPTCRGRGIAVIAGGVLNSGVIAGGTTFDYRPAAPDVRARVESLAGTCARFDVPLLAAALQFPLREPAVATVLLGARSVVELDDNLDALEVAIPDDLWSELDA